MNGSNNINDNSRLDTLIKVAVGLICLSGIIFTTTSWDSIPDLLKLVLLTIFGGSFYGLSIFTEKTLKLEKSSFMYWLLSMISIVVLILGLGYYKLFGNVLSFEPEGIHLLFSVIFFVVGLIIIRAQQKLKRGDKIDFCWYVFLLSIYNLIRQFNVGDLIALILIAVFLSLLYFMEFDNVYFNNLKKQLKLMNIILIFIYLTRFLWMIIDENNAIYIVGILIYYFNYFMLFKDKNDILDHLVINVITVVSIFLSLLSLFIWMNDANIYVVEDVYLFIMGIVTLIVEILFVNIYRENKSMYVTTSIIMGIASILYVLLSVDCYKSLNFVFVALCFIFNLYEIYRGNKVELYTQPIRVILLILFTLILLECEGVAVSLIYLAVFYGLVLFVKDKVLNVLYYILTLLTFLIFVLIGIDYIFYNVVAILFVFGIMFITYDKYKSLSKLIHVASLLTLYFIIAFITDELFLGFMADILLTVVFAFFNYENDKFSIKCSLIMLMFPLIYTFSLYEYNIIILIYSMYFLGLSMIFRYVVDKKVDSGTFKFYAVIAPLPLLAGNMFNQIIMWIMLVFYIMMAYEHDEYKGLNKYAIVLLILTILIRLMDFWLAIPFWAYLFICGIVLIVFVTRKEMDRKNNPVVNNPVNNVNYNSQVNYQNNNQVNYQNNGQVNYQNNNVQVVREPNFCTGCGKYLYGFKIYCSYCGKRIK